MCMLWLKFVFGLKFFEISLILVHFVSDYYNESETKKNEKFEKFQAKTNLNLNI